MSKKKRYNALEIEIKVIVTVVIIVVIKSARGPVFNHFQVNIGTYVHKAMYSVQNRPREGELVVNGMKVACVNSVISGWK